MKKNIRSFAVFLLAVTTFEGAESSTNEPWVNSAPKRLHSVSPEVECLFVEKGEQVFRALQTWKHTPTPENATPHPTQQSWNPLASSTITSICSYSSPAVTSKNLTDPTLDISFDDVVEKLNIPDLLYAPVTAGWMPSMLIRSWNKSTDDAYNQDRKHRLFSIISLCWYLDKIACTQENVSAISRGSWTLIEAQQNILHYLTDYVRLVTGTPNPKNQAFFCTQSNFAYRRDPNLKGSSHHAGRSPESQFGIDMRLEADQGILRLLPYSHTHILFSQIVHPDSLETAALLTFIKMEPLGMGSAVAAVGHGVNFLESKKAVADTARREKDIPPAIVKQYANIMHLEVSQVKDTTIAQMCCNIKKYCMEKSECDEKFNEFVDFCKQNKLDNPMVRTGNEVVLDCRSITKVEQCL